MNKIKILKKEKRKEKNLLNLLLQEKKINK
jgi:hypothetical protein